MSLRLRQEASPVATTAYPVATTTVIAGVVGQRVGIFRMVLQASGASTVQFQNTSDNSAISGTYTFTAAEFLVLDTQINGDPWWLSKVGSGIQMVVGVAAVVADISVIQGL